jgi:hypothetical protein
LLLQLLVFDALRNAGAGRKQRCQGNYIQQALWFMATLCAIDNGCTPPA